MEIRRGGQRLGQRLQREVHSTVPRGGLRSRYEPGQCLLLFLDEFSLMVKPWQRPCMMVRVHQFIFGDKNV